MATRTKKKVFTNVTVEQAQDAGSVFATTTAALQNIEAKMNAEITKIRDKYQDKITDLQEQLIEPQEILETFAAEQKDNWPKKSFELVHARIGFRTGMPKLKLDKGFNWTSVTELLKENFPDYVRTVDEPNKEKLIGDRDDESFGKIAKKCHFSVVQDETVFVEPKLEELAN